MGDERLGAVCRAVRLRRRLTQGDVGVRARVSRSTVSRLERGHLGTMSVDAIRAIGAVLEVRLDLVPHWRGGDLDRLMNARHSALHESVAGWFAAQCPDWIPVPEVSFSIYGERGIVDVLAWHAATRTLLVIELKTELVDVQEMLGTLDRKRRLARQIGLERDWAPRNVGVWLVMAASDMNRRRAAGHELTLRAALPQDGRAIRAWLRRPVGPIAAFSFFANARPGNGIRQLGGARRVRRRVGPVKRA